MESQPAWSQGSGTTSVTSGFGWFTRELQLQILARVFAASQLALEQI
jgi:hypothetical protein